MEEHPSRFVDRDMFGWWAFGVGEPPRYVNRPRYTTPGQPALTYEEAENMAGPLRPVESLSDPDRTLVDAALRSAGSRAVTTLAAALGKAWDDGLAQCGDDPDAAARALVAGRPTSWEADLLLEFAGFGRDLYLEQSKRIDPTAFTALHDVIARAVDDEGPHHELAATLGGIVSGIADERGDEGWSTVADQWLRPGGLARDDTATAYRLLYAHSEHQDLADVL